LRFRLSSRHSILLIAVGLLVCPLFWFPGDKIYLYGDDGALYFLAPARYFEKAAFVWSNYGGLGGVNSIMLSHLPFAGLLWVLQSLGLTAGQVQKLVWGLTLSCGFLFTYLLAKELLGRDDAASRVGSSVAGVAFILSPILIIVDWPTLLLNIYLVGALPVILYLYVRYLKTFSGRVLVGLLISITLSAAFLSQAPWVVPLVLGCGLALGLYYLLVLEVKIPPGKALARHAVLIVLALLLQSFWVIPLLSVGQGMSLVSPSALEEASFTVATLAARMNVHDYFLMLYPQRMGANPNRIGDLYPAFYSFKFLYLLSPLAIVWAMVIADGGQRRLITAFLAGLVVTLYLGTVNITEMGVWVFLWLTKHVPGWSMLRNFQAKGAMAVAFFYALTLGFAVAAITARYRRTGLVMAVSLAGILLVRAVPLLSGRVVTGPANLALDRGVITQVPAQYLRTLAYINRQPGEYGTVILPTMQLSNWGLYEWEKGIIAHNPAFLLLRNTVLNDLWSMQPAPSLSTWVREAIEAGDPRLFELVMALTATKYVMWHKDFDYPHAASWGLLLDNMRNPIETTRFVRQFEAKPLVDGSSVSLFELPNVGPRIYAGAGARRP